MVILNRIIGRVLAALGRDPLFWKLRRQGVLSYDRGHRLYHREVEGSRMYLIENDQGISRNLALNGTREPESVRRLREHLHPDMKVFELGMNLGFFLCIEGQVLKGGSGRIYGIEPSPDPFRIACLNAGWNGFEGITSLHRGAIVATAHASSSVDFNVSTASNWSALAYLDPDGQDFSDKIQVDAFTTEQFMKNCGIELRDLDFLRTDIDGAEYDILPDLYPFLRETESFSMFVEFHPYVNPSRHVETLRALGQFGFRCTGVTKEYHEGGAILRRDQPDATIAQLCESEFFLQKGGVEVFLRKG